MARLGMHDEDERECAEREDGAASGQTSDVYPDGFAVLDRREIYNTGRYRAVIENLDFMWRWRIYRDGALHQEGCSLSDISSQEAVRHVLAFYEIRDGDAANGDGRAGEA